MYQAWYIPFCGKTFQHKNCKVVFKANVVQNVCITSHHHICMLCCRCSHPCLEGRISLPTILRSPDFTALQYIWPECPQAINNILVEGGVTQITGTNENLPFTVLATALVGILQNAHQQDLLPREYFVNVRGFGPDTMTADDLIAWVGRLADEKATEEDTRVNAVEIGVPCGKDNKAAGHSIRKAISTLPCGDGMSESSNLVLKQRDYFLCHSTPPPPPRYNRAIYMGPARWVHHSMLTQRRGDGWVH